MTPTSGTEWPAERHERLLRERIADLEAKLALAEQQLDEYEVKGKSLCVQNGNLMVEHHDLKKENATLRQSLDEHEGMVTPIVGAESVAIMAERMAFLETQLAEKESRIKTLTAAIGDARIMLLNSEYSDVQGSLVMRALKFLEVTPRKAEP